ncbi:MAG: flagellar basal-body MS-ring/collar protein FliF [Acidovorax sp.]
MSAVAEVPMNANLPQAGAPPAPLPAWRQRLNALDSKQRLRLGAGAALLAAAVVAAWALNRQPDYRVLYSNLGDKDGGAIVAQLAQMNVPYKYTEGGGAIMVPTDRVYDLRLKLSTMGLPKGSVTGFELMDNSNKFGITQFQERLNFQRGLEGELTRSIQELSSVQGARVHLALPNQNGFFREQQKPSASVLLNLYPGRILDRAQIAGIVHLVASSVPELQPSAVSVLDDSGKLLSESPDGSGRDSKIDPQQVQYVKQMEDQYTRRILDILEPVVGKNNVKAQVTADVDFNQTEQTVEQHRPNLEKDTGAVRSQQILESTGTPGNQPPTGVPGATSNQPPQPATAPINGANPAPTAANSQMAPASAPGSKRESITNYEVDKTVRVTRPGSNNGVIRRMTAAVVVNYAAGTDAKGQPEAKPLTQAQLDQMTALVRETIGYNKDRGDSVNLMNAPFLVDNKPAAEVPLWKQPEVLELAKSWAWPVGMVLFALIVLFGLVRPALRQPKPPALGADGQPLLNALEGDDLERPALAAPAKPGEPTPEQLRLEEARRLAKENPVAVANIVKIWVNGGETA